LLFITLYYLAVARGLWNAVIAIYATAERPAHRSAADCPLVLSMYCEHSRNGISLRRVADATPACQSMLSGYLRAAESEIATSAQYISISLDTTTDKCLSPGGRDCQTGRCRRFPLAHSSTFKPVVVEQHAGFPSLLQYGCSAGVII